MNRTRIGGSRLKASVLGLGTSNWGLDVDEHVAGQLLRTYLSAGGNLIDTADVYGLGAAESIVGKQLAELNARDELLIATKAGGTPLGTDTSATHLRDALDESLRRMRVDYVDLWQVHDWDAGTPLDETLAALDQAVSSGRARFAGLCNYSASQTSAAVRVLTELGLAGVVSSQVEYSLINRRIEQDLIPVALANTIGVLAWGALGRGILTGKYLAGVPRDRAAGNFFQNYIGRYVNEESSRIARVVVEVADDVGCAPAAVAVAWVLARPAVSAALVGSRSVEQLTRALAAGAITLPDDAVKLLDHASEGAAITRFDVRPGPEDGG